MSWKINEGISGITITSPNLGFKTSDDSEDLEPGTSVSWETTPKDGYAAEVGSGWSRRTASSVSLDSSNTISPTAKEAYTGIVDIRWTGRGANKTYICDEISLITDEDATDDPFIDKQGGDYYTYHSEKHQTFKNKEIIFKITGRWDSEFEARFAGMTSGTLANCKIECIIHSGFSRIVFNNTVDSNTPGSANVGFCEFDIYKDSGTHYCEVQIAITPTGDNFRCYIQTSTTDYGGSTGGGGALT